MQKTPTKKGLTALFFACLRKNNYASGSFLFHQRKRAKAGSTIMAPNMFTTNIKVSKIPMSIWNLSDENTHVLTPIASVIPVKRTALPRSFNAAK